MKIITKIVGGLGNQMFQYAIGRSMALRYDAELLLDVYDFKTYRRPYFLDKFKILESYLSDDVALKYRKYEKRYSPQLFAENLKQISKRNYRLEKQKEYFKIKPDFLVPPNKGNVYLNGYWQNENYFIDIRSELQEEFILKDDFNISESAIYREATQSESIAVHFRRGSDQLNKPLYGVPQLEYYYQAIDIIQEMTTKQCKLFIFTNDDEWVKDNFKPKITHEYVSDANLADFQELVLMSHCKHHVIANSTFSWWGAWLCKHPKQIVVSPKKWFRLDKYDTDGLYAKKWIRI